jgi:hypothetical protein
VKGIVEMKEEVLTTNWRQVSGRRWELKMSVCDYDTVILEGLCWAVSWRLSCTCSARWGWGLKSPKDHIGLNIKDGWIILWLLTEISIGAVHYCTYMQPLLGGWTSSMTAAFPRVDSLRELGRSIIAFSDVTQKSQSHSIIL